MDLTIGLSGGRGIGKQLYAALREAILAGRLRAGERLPSSREFAVRLAVARNTVNEAYAQLASEGFIAARHGSGTYVSSHTVAPAADQRRGSAAVAPPLSRWARGLLPARPIVQSGLCPLTSGLAYPISRTFRSTCGVA